MFYIDNDLYANTRYEMSKFLNFDSDDYTLLDSFLANKIKEIPYSGAITITTQEGRPDLVCYDIYGSTQYWWLFMLYNDLLSPQEIKKGETYKFPSLANLENVYFTLSTRQKSKS